MTSIELTKVLLITDSTERTARLMQDLRRQYETCRIEAIHTLDEGFEWAARLAWDVILLDADHRAFPGLSCIRTLRARAPQAGIVLHTEHTVVSPLQAMRSGADAVLFRQSPDFTDQLLSAAQAAVYQKERPALGEPPQGQYLDLAESAGLVLYELNTSGEFTYVTPTLRRVLGYTSQELLGRHYSQLLDADSRRYAEQRFNERRAGARATRHLVLHLLPKYRKGVLRGRLHAIVSAKGLYAPSNMFLGTLGVIHGLGQTHLGRLTIGPPVATEPTGELGEPAPSWETIETFWQKLQHFLGKPSDESLIAEDECPSTSSSESSRPEPLTPAPLTDTQPPSASHREPAAGETTAPQSNTVLADQHQRELPPHLFPIAIRSESGTASGITTSLDAAGLQFHLTTPTIEVPTGQASIHLATDVMVLPLTGMVLADTVRPSAGRALFDPVEDIQRAVLLSFLEALREDPDCLKVEIVIAGTALSPSPPAPSPQISWKIENGDRRQDFRLSCTGEAFLTSREDSLRDQPFSLNLVNISLRGCCFHSGTQLSNRQDPFDLILPPINLAPATQNGPSGAAAGSVPGAALGSGSPAPLPISIVWEKPPAPAGTPIDREHQWIYGARVAPTPDGPSEDFRRLVARQALSVMDDAGQRSARHVVTDLLSCINPYDRRIALYHDSDPHHRCSLSPLVIIAPEFAHPKEQYAELAYYLARQGMQVLRYDCTNHVGESDAVTPHATLSDMLLDLVTVLDFAAEFWPSSPTFVIGHGIGGRIAARGLKDHLRLAGLLLLHVPLDLDEALPRLQHTDVDPMQVHNPDFETGTIFGLNVNARHVLQDAISSGLAGTQEFLDDLQRLRAPTGIFVPLEEAAAHRDILDRIRAALGEACRFVTFLAEPITRAPVLSLRPENWADRIARFCLTEASARPQTDALAPMPFEDFRIETGLELTRVRCLHHRSSVERASTWNNYAIHSRTLLNLPDYWKMLERSCQLLGPLDSARRLLCIGDASGHLGTFLLTHHAYRLRTLGPSGPDSPSYTGLDFHVEALIQSRQTLLSIQTKLSRESTRAWPADRSLMPSFCLGDLDGPLPLSDNSYDAVSCHIVLGHCADPLSTLRECLRVLVPGGRLVLLCLQPATDLSAWYRHQLSGGTPRPAPSSSALLRAFGEFQRGYLEGTLRRFTHRQVELLLETAGGHSPTVEPALAHHVHLASTRKPYSTG